MNSSLQAIIFYFFSIYYGSDKKAPRKIVSKIMESFYRGDRIIFENEDCTIIFSDNILEIEMKNNKRIAVLNILRKIIKELKFREEIYEKIEVKYIEKNRISFIFPAP